MAFNEYLTARHENLQSSLCNAEYMEIIDAIDAVYRQAPVDALDQSRTLAELWLVSIKGLYGAAAHILERLPEDAGACMRRGAELARVALAVHIDPRNGEIWVNEERRQERWDARMRGENPPRLPIQYHNVSTSSLYRRLTEFIGILSDAQVHFTPEYLSTQNREVVSSANGSRLELRYFAEDDLEVVRSLAFLAALHLMIVEAFDACLEGALRRDTNWAEAVNRLIRIGRDFGVRHGLRGYPQEVEA